MDDQRHHTREADVLVIGGGVVGVATALAVCRQGRSAVLLEAAGPGPATGSSKGTARIYAPAAYPDHSYLEMGLRALEAWRELERASGEALLQTTGALSHGHFATEELPALLDAGVAAELISPRSAFERFGVAINDDVPLLHQGDAGVIRADVALRALQRGAQAAGAAIVRGETVIDLEEIGEGVEATTSTGIWRGGIAVVAAGARTAALLARIGRSLPVSSSIQSVAYFDLEGGPESVPMTLMDFEGEEPFACWDPVRGMKAAFHARGPSPDPGHGQEVVDPDAIERIVSWVRDRYPELRATLRETETCLYTNTRDERFLIERDGQLVVASACNGQGFQFAPASGRRAAELALGAGGAPAGLTP